jgi:hypothetical protein
MMIKTGYLKWLSPHKVALYFLCPFNSIVRYEAEQRMKAGSLSGGLQEQTSNRVTKRRKRIHLLRRKIVLCNIARPTLRVGCVTKGDQRDPMPMGL